MKYLTYLAIAGNAAYILWVTYSGIDEGFSGGMVMVASYVGLMVFYSLMSGFLSRERSRRFNRSSLRVVECPYGTQGDVF